MKEIVACWGSVQACVVLLVESPAAFFVSDHVLGRLCFSVGSICYLLVQNFYS